MGIRRIIKNYIYREKFKIKEKEVKDNLKKQSILVTGANSGIGLALTKKFLDSYLASRIVLVFTFVPNWLS